MVDISEGKSRFVHYRDSKLTFLLKDCLGGNSKTSIIANISAALTSYNETLSTLKFAQRAKLIKNKVIVNEDSSGTLDSLKSEIKRLRYELATVRGVINLNEFHIIPDSRLVTNRSFSPTATADHFFSPKSKSKNDIERNTRFYEENLTNQKNLEMEIFLKQSLEILTESELHLHNELSKKEDIIEKLKSAYEIYDKNELQLRLIIKLLEVKVNRYKESIEKGFTKENYFELIDEDKEGLD